MYNKTEQILAIEAAMQQSMCVKLQSHGVGQEAALALSLKNNSVEDGQL
jgi:hypothetical protein